MKKRPSMKAAVQEDIGVLKVAEVPEPQPGPDQVKVKIAYCDMWHRHRDIRRAVWAEPAGRPGKVYAND